MKTTKQLVADFHRGVCYPEVSGFEILELLDLRSVLARQEDTLSEEEKQVLEEADSLFLEAAARLYASVVCVADLEAIRKQATVPPSHWWWRLEKLARVERIAS